MARPLTFLSFHFIWGRASWTESYSEAQAGLELIFLPLPSKAIVRITVDLGSTDINRMSATHSQAESQAEGKPSLQQIFRSQSHGGHRGRKFSLVWVVLGNRFPAPALLTFWTKFDWHGGLSHAVSIFSSIPHLYPSHTC